MANITLAEAQENLRLANADLMVERNPHKLIEIRDYIAAMEDVIYQMTTNNSSNRGNMPYNNNGNYYNGGNNYQQDNIYNTGGYGNDIYANRNNGNFNRNKPITHNTKKMKEHSEISIKEQEEYNKKMEQQRHNEKPRVNVPVELSPRYPYLTSGETKEVIENNVRVLKGLNDLIDVEVINSTDIYEFNPIFNDILKSSKNHKAYTCPLHKVVIPRVLVPEDVINKNLNEIDFKLPQNKNLDNLILKYIRLDLINFLDNINIIVSKIKTIDDIIDFSKKPDLDSVQGKYLSRMLSSIRIEAVNENLVTIRFDSLHIYYNAINLNNAEENEYIVTELSDETLYTLIKSLKYSYGNIESVKSRFKYYVMNSENKILLKRF